MNKIQTIIDKKGIRLNAMQEASVDAILHTDKDLVILSPTGSGKTLAYLLPLVQCLDPASDQLQAIVIVPSRELAIQSNVVLNDMGTGLRSFAAYGGRAAMDEHRLIRKTLPQILFATPGRLKDHLEKQNVHAEMIKWVILDEFDKSLEMGFLNEMSAVFHLLPSSARRIFLSATDLKDLPDFVNMSRTTKLNFLSDDEKIPSRIQMFKVISPEKDKLNTLFHLLMQVGDESSIVFLNHRESVERTAGFLRQKGFCVSSYHGGLEQKEREAAIYKFANGSTNVLVSTDLSSRGLDMPIVGNIIHYHMPETEEIYIHRVGRTARWDASGRVFFILGGKEEKIPEFITDEVLPYGLSDSDQRDVPPVPRMETIYVGKGKKDKLSKKDLVGFLCKKGMLRIDEIGRIDVKDYYSYAAVVRTKLNQVLQLTKGEKIKGIKTIVDIIR